MISLLITWVLSALCLFLTAMVVPKFKIESFGSAMWAAVLVGFFNMWLTPVLMFLSLPLTFLTLGFFVFVVNAAVLKLAAKILKGFDIEGWWPAILGAIVLAVAQALIFTLAGGGGSVLPTGGAI